MSSARSDLRRRREAASRLLHRHDASASAARRARSRARSGTSCPRTASSGPARATTTPGSSTRTRGGTSRSSSSESHARAPDPIELDGEIATADGSPEPLRWLMESDVCKHCTHAGCLDACPTGALFRTEFGTVVVQEDVCNGCGYCVPACPFGVIDKRDLPRSADDAPLSLPLLGKKEDGRVWKCTLCYDRLKGGHEPACAKACPTHSIQFGELDELRERARAAAREARGGRAGTGRASTATIRTTASAASARSSCCSTSRRSTACRPTRWRRSKHLPRLWRTTAHRRDGDVRRPRARIHRWRRVSGESITEVGTEMESYYGRPILKEPTWTAGDPDLPLHRRRRRRLCGAARLRAR